MSAPLMRFIQALLVLSAGALPFGSVLAVDTPAAVTRCGWFSNPTPANAWLVDREAEWTVGIQGGHQAEGDWPRFKPSQWVETNGHHGYGCACLDIVADPGTHDVAVIKAARARSLGFGRKDRRLKEPQ